MRVRRGAAQNSSIPLDKGNRIWYIERTEGTAPNKT